MKIKLLPIMLAVSLLLTCGGCRSSHGEQSSIAEESSEKVRDEVEELTEKPTEPVTEPITEVSEDEKQYLMKGFSFNIGKALRPYHGAYSDKFKYTFRLINDVYQSSVVGVTVTDEVRVSASLYGEAFLKSFGEDIVGIEKSEYEVNGFDACEFSGTMNGNDHAKVRFVTISSPKGTLLSFMAIYLSKYDKQYEDAFQALLETVTYDETAVSETPDYTCPEFSIKSAGNWGISAVEESTVIFGYTKADSVGEMNSLVRISADSKSSRIDAETAARAAYDSFSEKNAKPEHEECELFGYNAHHIHMHHSSGAYIDAYFFETDQVLYSVQIMLMDDTYDELFDSAMELLRGLVVTNPKTS